MICFQPYHSQIAHVVLSISQFVTSWPFGREKPSTASEKRTTNLSGVISAFAAISGAVIALSMAVATSFRTLSFLHAFGNHVTCMNGMCFYFVYYAFHWSG
mmetsp:Transcript_53723/g.64800  ORF Transcript_53723/g.64800 Transcript_53723/m.64800 type:complete len:101 (+) Transcript_53723:171-473(+)